MVAAVLVMPNQTTSPLKLSAMGKECPLPVTPLLPTQAMEIPATLGAQAQALSLSLVSAQVMPIVRQGAVGSTAASVPVQLLRKNVMEAADSAMLNPTTELLRLSGMVAHNQLRLQIMHPILVAQLVTLATLDLLAAISTKVFQALKTSARPMAHNSSQASVSATPTVPLDAVVSTRANVQAPSSPRPETVAVGLVMERQTTGLHKP